MEGRPLRWLRIETDDDTLLPALEAARIDGLRVSRDMQAGGTGLGILVAIEILRDLAAPLFVAWLSAHLINHKRNKTTINGVNAPHDLQQLTVIVMGGEQVEHHQPGQPAQKNKKQRLHRKSPKGKKK